MDIVSVVDCMHMVSAKLLMMNGKLYLNLISLYDR